ncbi:hypothetical protein D3C80_619430 [compost metagenome]
MQHAQGDAQVAIGDIRVAVGVHVGHADAADGQGDVFLAILGTGQVVDRRVVLFDVTGIGHAGTGVGQGDIDLAQGGGAVGVDAYTQITDRLWEAD